MINTPTELATNQYQIEINESFQHDELKQTWLKLEKLAFPPFFLTWSWISCWLKTYEPEVIVVRAKSNQDTVAIGIFTLSTQYRRGVIRSHQLRLHQVGNPLLDQICIEYNGFLCHPSHKKDASLACLQRLMAHHQDWDEIILANSPSEEAKKLERRLCNTRLDYETTCYSYDLTKLSIKNYIDSLSKNTRYQIRRSIRLFEQRFGPLHLEVASSEDQALDWFIQAGAMHQERWPDSGYKNRYFVKFHQNLITQNYRYEKIQLLRVTFGKVVIAYLYFFSLEKIAYFYLQGIKYFDEKKLKPGLVAHVLAVQHFLDNGYEKYDFMAGHSQYKLQLSNQQTNLETVIIRNENILLVLEEYARRFKQFIKQ